MISLLKIEVFKIFKRPRTYIAFAVIALIIILIQIALKFGGEEYVGLMLSGMGDSFEDVPSQDLLNGYLVCFIILNLLRSEEHTSELQSQSNLVCRLLLEKKKK